MMDIDYQNTLQFLHYYLKENSKQTFNKYCKGKNLSIVDVQTDTEEIDTEEMSMIVLWGTLGTIILKTHFKLSTANYFLSGEHSAMSEENIKMSRDFMKEFSNMQAGHIRGVLEENKIILGMSLPFLALGSDEKIFQKLRDERVNVTTWKLVDENQNFLICSAESNLRDHTLLKNIQSTLNSDLEKNNSSAEIDAEGDVMFL